MLIDTTTLASGHVTCRCGLVDYFPGTPHNCSYRAGGYNPSYNMSMNSMPNVEFKLDTQNSNLVNIGLKLQTLIDILKGEE